MFSRNSLLRAAVAYKLWQTEEHSRHHVVRQYETEEIAAAFPTIGDDLIAVADRAEFLMELLCSCICRWSTGHLPVDTEASERQSIFLPT